MFLNSLVLALEEPNYYSPIHHTICVAPALTAVLPLPLLQPLLLCILLSTSICALVYLYICTMPVRFMYAIWVHARVHAHFIVCGNGFRVATPT